MENSPAGAKTHKFGAETHMLDAETHKASAQTHKSVNETPNGHGEPDLTGTSIPTRWLPASSRRESDHSELL